MKKKTKKLKTYLGCVYRDINRQLEKQTGLKKYFEQELSLFKQLLTQEKHSPNKLYSLHAPEIEVLPKAKYIKNTSLALKPVL